MKTKGSSALPRSRWAAGTFIVSLWMFSHALGLQAQVPPGCTGNVPVSAIGFLPGGHPPAVSTLKVHIGDTIFYQVQVGVAGTACQASNVNVVVKSPDGTVVQFLSAVTIFQGDTVTCPGDPR